MTVSPFDNGNPSVKEIPLEAFDASPELRAMTLFLEAPAAVYAGVLTNVASRIPPGVLTPIGTPVNLHTVVRGEASTGKRATWRDADSIVEPKYPAVIPGTTWVEALSELKFRDNRYVAFQMGLGGLYQHLLGGGARIRNKFLAMWRGDRIVLPRGRAIAAGTYRCTVQATIHPWSNGWLFTPYAVEQGITNMFLYTLVDRYDDGWYEVWRKDEPLSTPVTLPDWTAVPVGPTPVPDAAKEDAERYSADDTPVFEKQLIDLRFKVAMCHAALHGRAVISDEDWVWSKYPMELSRSICFHEFDVAQREWRWEEGTSPVRHRIVTQ